MNSEEKDVLDGYVNEYSFHKLSTFCLLFIDGTFDNLLKHLYLVIKSQTKLWKL